MQRSLRIGILLAAIAGPAFGFANGLMPGMQLGGLPQLVPMDILEPPEESGLEFSFTPYWDPSVLVHPGYVLMLEGPTADIMDPTNWSDIAEFLPNNGVNFYSDPYFPTPMVSDIQAGLAQGMVPILIEDLNPYQEYTVGLPGGPMSTYRLWSDAVPEPVSIAALALGFGALINRRRSRTSA